MICSCGGKIRIERPQYLVDDPPYPPTEIYCLSCNKKYTWKEYQALRCEKLVEMMRKNS